MTSYKTITGSLHEVNNLFENAKAFSVRYYNRIINGVWDITIRHNDENGIGEKIRKATSAKELLIIDKEYSHET